MSRSAPLLSIVIPTRNRIKYVTHAINSILSIQSSELELVIQDSSDSRNLGLWLQENISDGRLLFNYSEPPMSMTDNFNSAIRLAGGEYVCMIGDDDGVNPEIVTATRWASKNGLDALVPHHGGASYRWPDFQSRYYGSGQAGKLFINAFSGAKSYPNTDVEMQRCVQSAGQSKFDLPIVYLGIIRRQCMIEVSKKAGAYFKGISPDIFGALAVANYARRVCVIDYPLVLPGSSGGSSSGRSAMGKHKGPLKDDPHMQAFKDLSWPVLVPEFFSVQTVWAEGAVEALQAMGRTDLLSQFNVARLHALCVVLHPDYMMTTLQSLFRALKVTKIGYFKGTLQFATQVVVVCWGQLKRIIFRLIHPKRGLRELEFSGLGNIEVGVQALTKYLETTGQRFEEAG